MKINFTKKEYRLLMDMIKIADWVLRSHAIEDDDFKKTEYYRPISQKIMGHAQEAGCADRVKFDKKLDRYFVSYDYEMNGDYMAFVKAFEDDSFWEHLIRRLAERDFLEQTPESVGEQMSSDEVFNRIEELKEPYIEAFSEQGIEHLKLVNKPGNAVH